MEPAQRTERLIIDCDPGNGSPAANVDDALALLFALRHPELAVQAVWTVFGNVPVAAAHAAAERLVRQARADRPVVRRGAAQALPRDRSARLASALLPTLAADLHAAGDGVVLACLGPLTNVATLVLQAPGALAGVRRIWVMGGTIDGRRVDTNFALDPLAARVVLHSGLPVTVVPWDVTRSTSLSWAAWQRIREEAAAAPGVEVEPIAEWLEPWLRLSSLRRPRRGMRLHDLAVVAGIAEPGIGSTRAANVAVLDAPQGKLELAADGVPVELVTGVDNEALVAAWRETVLRRPA